MIPFQSNVELSLRELDLAFAKIVKNKDDAFLDFESLKDDLAAGLDLKDVTLLPLQEAVDAGQEMFGDAEGGKGGGGESGDGLAHMSRKPAELAVAMAALKIAKKTNGEWRMTAKKKDEAEKMMRTIVRAKLAEAEKGKEGDSQVESVYFRVSYDEDEELGLGRGRGPRSGRG